MGSVLPDVNEASLVSEFFFDKHHQMQLHLQLEASLDQSKDLSKQHKLESGSFQIPEVFISTHGLLAYSLPVLF